MTQQPPGPTHEPAGATEPLRLAALLVPLSLITDLGMDHADEHAARACLLATRLAERMGLASDARADVYYATLLAHVGCTATAAPESERLGGDETATRPLISRSDFARGSELRTVLTSIGTGQGPLSRARIVGTLLTGTRWAREVERSICEVASLVATRLDMSTGVRQALEHGYER